MTPPSPSYDLGSPKAFPTSMGNVPHSRPPLCVFPGTTRWIKDSSGWARFFKDGVEIWTLGNKTPSYKRPEPAGVTLEDVIARYAERTKRWRESAEYASVDRFLRETILEEEGMVVDQCVCVALSSFTNTTPPLQNRSMDQLAFLETVLEILREFMSAAACSSPI